MTNIKDDPEVTRLSEKLGGMGKYDDSYLKQAFKAPAKKQQPNSLCVDIYDNSKSDNSKSFSLLENNINDLSNIPEENPEGKKEETFFRGTLESIRKSSIRKTEKQQLQN